MMHPSHRNVEGDVSMTRTADLQYPIGRFDPKAQWTPSSRRAALEDIAGLPASLRRAVSGLDDAQLDTAYRPGGWSVRQVVHHLADSYIHGYIRLKAALTEENPTIKPYNQDAWAGLPDGQLPIAPSLAILDAVGERWMAVWHALGDREFARVYTHATLGPLTVETHLHFFAWHSRHHMAHVTTLRECESWG
jgi:DinB superfamily